MYKGLHANSNQIIIRWQYYTHLNLMHKIKPVFVFLLT